MSRKSLTAMLGEFRSTGRTALLPFMTAGLPSTQASPGIFAAMEGADGFELGIPYSDPLMDGPVIQEASRRALLAGTDRRAALGVAREVVRITERPLLVMTYANVVLRAGPDRFAQAAAEAGAAGVIVADVPLEEALPLMPTFHSWGLGTVLFAAPTTSDSRLDAIAHADPIFIYGIADMGVTGERDRPSEHAAALARRVRERTDLPLVMGVGVSTPGQAAALAPLCDGIIVGSALVRRVLEADGPQEAEEAVRAAVAELRSALS